MKRFFLLALAALALSAPAVQTGHAVYRPGLTQARIPLYEKMGYPTPYTGYPRFASNLLERASAEWLDRTLDVFKDGGPTNAQGKTTWNENAINPLSGKTWPWLYEENHGVFAYEGELWVEEGTNYYFYGRTQDGAALVVNGETVVHQGKRSAYNYAPEVRKFWTAPRTGWVPFNAWLWSWQKKGAEQNSQWGLQYNVAGFALEGLEELANPGLRHYSYNSYTNVWRRFVDPGNGTFLRTVTGERFTTVGASAATGGGRSFALSFEGVPTNATLVAFSGAFDGFHNASEWDSASAVLAEIPPGNTTTNIEVELGGSAKVLRFRLAHFDAASTNGLEVFEEWTEMFPVSPQPAVRVDAAAPGYTNVVVTGTLGSLGIDGSSAAVTVEIAAASDAAFSDPIATNLLPLSSTGTFRVELFGLSTNTAYLVRATASNNLDVADVSAPVEFRTHAPGPASASVAATVCALHSAKLAATISDWGGGSWDAEAWIDVSADESFPENATQVFPLGILSGDPPIVATETATDLEMNHGYFARCRVVNSWGVETVSETSSFKTDDKPIGFPETALTTPAGGSVFVTLAPTFVTEGTVYDVSLEIRVRKLVNGVIVETVSTNSPTSWTGQDSVRDFPYRRYASAGSEVQFTYTVDWRNESAGLSGQFIIPGQDAAAQLADLRIKRLPMIDPDYADDDYHGVYLRVGDKIEVVPSEGARIDWHTNAVLSVTPTNGVFLVEALEPGAALLYETDLATDQTNNVTGVAIVLPAENPAGGIYVHRKLEDFYWDDPGKWEMVVPGPQGYPDAAGAWVYIATPANPTDGPDSSIQIVNPVTVGNLAVGQLGWIHHGFPKTKSHWSWTFGDFDGLGGEIHFDSGDGSESRILTLGHAYNVSRVQFQVPVFSKRNGLAVDELWRVQDDIGAWANTWDFGLSFERSVDFGTNTFRNIRGYLYHYPATKVWSSVECNGSAARGFLQFYGDILGSGTIRLEADSMVGCVQGETARDLSFTGTWDVANGQNISCYGGSGFTWPGTSLGRSREMIVRGSWLRAETLWNGGAFVRNADEGDNWHMFKGWTNDWRALPPKLTLDGGCLYLHPNYMSDELYNQYSSDPAKTRRIDYDVGTFTVPAGPMGFLSLKKSNSSLRYPDQYMTVTNLDLAPGAVLALEMSDSAVNKTNELVIVNDPAGWQDPDDDDRQFLPYLFANQQTLSNPQYRGTNPYIVTGSAVDNDHLFFRDTRTKRVARDTPAASGNGYRRWAAGEELADGSYHSMQLAANVTNSFAPGATVTNLAGYLDMRKGAALGRPGLDAGATLDFGDQPARIYVGNWNETGAIGCKMAGSGGLVKGGSGVLALGASAAGVKGGVRVAGGTLDLGAVDGSGTLHPGRVAGDVRVEAGSRLVVRDKASFVAGARLFLNDRDWIPSYAHVRLEPMEGNVEVKKLYVAGEPMPNGYYGSSEAAAAHPTADVVVDDVHFEGTGLLWAGVRPTMMIFR